MTTVTRTTMPLWAKRIAQDTCNRYRIYDMHIRWYSRSDQNYSTGYCDYRQRHIVITAGRRQSEAKVTLLHELAHLVSRQKHTQKFWIAMVYLCVYHRCVKEAYRRENRNFAQAWRTVQARRRTAMARCSECKKFVSTERGEPEMIEEHVSDYTVTLKVAIRDACSECGSEIREAFFDIEETYASAEGHQDCTHVLEIVDLSGTERNEGKGRGLKTFVGFHAEWEIKCDQHGGEIVAEGTSSDDMQISAMGSLQ